MDFDILPDARMGNKPNAISLPRGFRQELGALIGQFLHLQGSEELVLEICEALDPEQLAAYVSPQNFKKLKGQVVQFKILDITLGCDPEFFIFWGAQRISAATYLPFVGQVGCDGGLGELRPMYGLHEDQVTNNLQSLILQIPRHLRRAPWATGYPRDGSAFTYEAHSFHSGGSAGFHIHLGLPAEILNTRSDFNRETLKHLVRCLDWYVSVPLVPLEVDHRRRLGHAKNFGKPGDYRLTNVTLEYRTPGAFYLRSPKLARGILGAALLITEVGVSRIKAASQGFLKLGKLSPGELNELLPTPAPLEVRKALLDKDTRVAGSRIPEIRESLRELPNYEKHREAIEELFRTVEEQERPGPNLLYNWKELA